MIVSSGKSRAATELMSRTATWPAIARAAVTQTVAVALANADVVTVQRAPTINRLQVMSARSGSQNQPGLMRMLPTNPARTAVATTARAAIDLAKKNTGAAASQYSGSTMNMESP